MATLVIENDRLGIAAPIAQIKGLSPRRLLLLQYCTGDHQQERQDMGRG
ncbi:MAG: hypothetical protein WA230_07310 [Xanthobacteraceae bacterium]